MGFRVEGLGRVSGVRMGEAETDGTWTAPWIEVSAALATNVARIPWAHR